MEIRVLAETEQEAVRFFLENHPEETVELAGRIERYGLRNDRLHKRAGTVCGIFSGGNLTGLLHFSNHGSLACHFTDPEILKKVVFLKTIRQYRPKNILGTVDCADPIYHLIAKSLRDIRYSECCQMFYDHRVAEPLLLPAGMAVVDARQFDLNRAVDFLIESEKAFGRKPRMVNDLRVRIQDREDQDAYVFLLDQDRVVSQALIEFYTSRYGRIAGVYTAAKERGKGYGALLMAHLIYAIQDQGRTPTLLVEKRNRPALSLYEKNGFRRGTDCVVLDIEWDEGSR